MNETEFDITGLENDLLAGNGDLRHLSAEEQFSLLSNRSAEILQSTKLRMRLQRTKDGGLPLVVKYGIDPTSQDIHLGHIVPLIIARRLQLMGHHLVLVFGDFTAYVGDPSGRVATRPVLTKEQIESNAVSYKEQVAKFVDINEAEIVFNSTFYDAMTVRELFGLYRKVRIQPLLQRDDFRSRLEGLTAAETLYPTLMAIDSVRIKPDLELGGKDQLLNFQAAISMMEAEGMEPEAALTTDLLLGTTGDGSKMSKSKGNFIALTDSAKDVFGKIMSIPDKLLRHYFTLLTPISDLDYQVMEEAMESGKLSPMIVKRMLARVITTILHNCDQAKSADDEFVKLFSKREIPEDIPTFEASPEASIVEVLADNEVVKSRGEARKLILQGGLYIVRRDSNERVSDVKATLPKGPETTLKLGKRRFIRIVTS